MLDKAISIGASIAKDKEAGQGALFGGGDSCENVDQTENELPKTKPWTKAETLNQEKGVLGIHVSGHPLDEHGDCLESWCTDSASTLKESRVGKDVVVGGVITSVRIVVIRNGRSAGKKMAILSLQDREGKFECVAFSDSYQQFAHLLQQDAVVLVVGKTDNSRGEVQILVDKVASLQDATLYLAKTIELTFYKELKNSNTKGQMELVSGLLKQAGAAKVASGASPAEVVVHINSGNQVTTIKSQRRVVVEPKLVQQIGEVIGQDNIRLISGY